VNTLIISFSGKQIHLLEITEKKEIVFFDSLYAEYNINDNLILERFNDTLVFSYSELINRSIKGRKYNDARIGLLLNTNLAFINVLPLDYSHPDETIRSNIIWDLSIYFPEHYKEFSVNYSRIKRNFYSPNISESLVVALHKVKMEFIKSIFEFCNLNLQIVDLDHFAAEKCIRILHSNEFSTGPGLIIGFKKDRIDLSIIDEKNLFYYDYIITGSKGYKNSTVSTLKKIYENNLDSVFKNIYLYGDTNLTSIQSSVSEVFSDKEVKIPNPLPLFNHTAISKVIDNFENEGYKYLPLFGLVLKTI
jgi:hypothetical protein